MSAMTSYLLQTLLVLGIVCVFAVVALYGARRVGVARAHGPIELLGSLPLEARRSVYLLRVGDKVFLVGASESGFTKIGELDQASLPRDMTTLPKSKFRDVLLGLAVPKEGPERPSSNDVSRVSSDPASKRGDS